MNWDDTGFLLSKNRYNENSLITEIYTKNHVIIIHREDKSSDDLNMILNPLVIKKYRRSKIIFAKFLN